MRLGDYLGGDDKLATWAAPFYKEKYRPEPLGVSEYEIHQPPMTTQHSTQPKIDTHGALKMLVSSRLRMEILRSVDKPVRLSDLGRLIGAQTPNVSAKAKDLQKLGLVERINGDYSITRSGELVQERLMVLVDTLDVLTRHSEFWCRVIADLPEEVFNSLHIFKGAKFIKKTKEDLYCVEKELFEFIRNSKNRLLLVLPVKSERISDEVNKMEKRLKIKVVSPGADNGLNFGLAISKNGIMIFTDLFDMALVSIEP